jgi:hypothetical protein
MVNRWNETERDYPIAQTQVYELVQKHMQLVPNNPAVAYNNEYVTYSQLESSVNQLAKVLLNFGVGPSIWLVLISLLC